MKVLYCNKFNYRFGGTEAYLFELMARVEARGHETALFSMDHRHASTYAGRSYLIPKVDFKDPTAGVLKKIRMAAHAIYSPGAKARMSECLKDFVPDIAHVRGIYHHLSPSILWELKRQRVPVLYHVNDFKMLCPAYNFVAHGAACEACASGHYYRAVIENCYTGGRWRATVLAAEAYVHRWLRTYARCVDLFLAPSEFVRQRLSEAGFPAERIEVLPHLQSVPEESELLPDQGYVLYFGRLSPEKGLDELLQAMKQLPYVPLFIAGDGPERARLEALVRHLDLKQVFFTGSLEGSKLDRLVAGCRFSIFPSRAYETLGKSILESYAWGRPVVATDLGSRRELIEHGFTGVLYAPGDIDQLAGTIGYLFKHPGLTQEMGALARRRLREKHDPEKYMDALLGIYSRLAVGRRSVSVRGSENTGSPSAGIRICFIGGRGVASKYSGIESYYEKVGGEMARLGHDVTVYCRTYFTPRIFEYKGMRVRRLPTLQTKHLDTLVHTFLSTVAATFSRCDIVHYHCLGPALFSFLPRLAGKKTIVTVHGLDWQRRKWGRFASWGLRIGESAAVILPNTTEVVSKTLQQYYRKRYGRETVYVPNGANPVERRNRKRLLEWDLLPDQYVLYLGRFSPEKNCHMLIDAFERIATDMKLVLAGGTSHTDSYVEGLRRHASERILLLPWISGEDLDELLSNAAVFVLPSDLEGLSMALLDAMGAGVCVLTSDIPENRELVDEVGFTFQRGNREDLRRMMEVLVSNPSLRRQMGMKARERIREHYRWPEVAKMIEKSYYDVLGWEPPDRLALAAAAGASVGGHDIGASFD